MEYTSSNRPNIPVKIVVAGGFGVGKTTFVSAISEIEPLKSEAIITEQGAGVDTPIEGSAKTETTVAMDFGRITLPHSLVLYLFGTPGQDRFHFMWNELARGAIGAVVLVDTRRIEACFPAVDFFEKRETPFIVAVNTFDGRRLHSLDDVREALRLGNDVPLVYCDARSREDVKRALVSVVETAIKETEASADRSSTSRPPDHPVESEVTASTWR